MLKKHPRYYKGKLLKSEDFTNVEVYHKQLLQQQCLLYHASGILRGLHVKKQSDTTLLLTKGYAIDEQGQFLQVEQNVEIDLREVEGFTTIQGNIGYVSISHEELVADETYCEYSHAEEHKEYDSYVDSWKISMHSQKPRSTIREALFHKTILYKEDRFLIYQYLPMYLPFQQDIPVFVKVESTTPIQGNLEYVITSSHYETTRIKMNLAQEECQQFTLKIIKKIGGKVAEFKLSDMMLEVQQSQVQVEGQTSFQLAFSEQLKKEYRHRLYDVIGHEKHGVVLAKLHFKYVLDQLIIQSIDEQVRTYSPQPIVEDIVTTMLDTIYIASNKEETKKEELPLQASGVIPITFEQRDHVFYSNELQHHLGRCKCDIQTSLEVQKDGISRMYQGDMSLFLNEAIEISLCQYPTKGTFQVAMRKPTNVPYTKLYLHWFAKKYKLEEGDGSLHLIRLQPSAITLLPKQSCPILPVFNLENQQGDVVYEMVDAAGGEISTEGIFKAGNVEGIYQIKASYQDDVAYAYVKVIEDKHE